MHDRPSKSESCFTCKYYKPRCGALGGCTLMQREGEVRILTLIYGYKDRCIYHELLYKLPEERIRFLEMKVDQLAPMFDYVLFALTHANDEDPRAK